ncbi:MAG TPA: PAS domain-containing protein [Methanoregula sp.]|nr:PAS domain-containing protein [Methanoregula sp.]
MMGNNTAADEATRIRQILKDQPLGLSIKEISAAVGMSRNSVAKYLEVLTATGQLELRHVGNAKLYTLSQRVPVTSIINFAKELIIIIDKSLRIVEASDSLCAFAGAPKTDIIKTRLSSPPVSLLSPAEEGRLYALLNGGSSWKKEILIVRGSEERYLDGRFIPTRLQNGEPGITLILEDTTVQRQAERAMQERDRLLHTIFQIPTVPRFFIDKNHKVVFWDRALEILTGFKSEEMVGTSLHWKAFFDKEMPCLVDLLVDGDTGQIKTAFNGTCRRIPSNDSGYECTSFFPHIGPLGKWLHVTATLIRDSTGSVTGAMETVEDVTRKKQKDFIVEE